MMCVVWVCVRCVSVVLRARGSAPTIIAGHMALKIAAQNAAGDSLAAMAFGTRRWRGILSMSLALCHALFLFAALSGLSDDCQLATGGGWINFPASCMQRADALQAGLMTGEVYVHVRYAAEGVVGVALGLVGQAVCGSSCPTEPAPPTPFPSAIEMLCSSIRCDKCTEMLNMVSSQRCSIDHEETVIRMSLPSALARMHAPPVAHWQPGGDHLTRSTPAGSRAALAWAACSLIVPHILLLSLGALIHLPLAAPTRRRALSCLRWSCRAILASVLAAIALSGLLALSLDMRLETLLHNLHASSLSLCERLLCHEWGGGAGSVLPPGVNCTHFCADIIADLPEPRPASAPELVELPVGSLIVGFRLAGAASTDAFCLGLFAVLALVECVNRLQRPQDKVVAILPGHAARDTRLTRVTFASGSAGDGVFHGPRLGSSAASFGLSEGALLPPFPSTQTTSDSEWNRSALSVRRTGSPLDACQPLAGPTQAAVTRPPSCHGEAAVASGAQPHTAGAGDAVADSAAAPHPNWLSPESGSQEGLNGLLAFWPVPRRSGATSGWQSPMPPVSAANSTAGLLASEFGLPGALQPSASDASMCAGASLAGKSCLACGHHAQTSRTGGHGAGRHCAQSVGHALLAVVQLGLVPATVLLPALQRRASGSVPAALRMIGVDWDVDLSLAQLINTYAVAGGPSLPSLLVSCTAYFFLLVGPVAVPLAHLFLLTCPLTPRAIRRLHGASQLLASLTALEVALALLLLLPAAGAPVSAAIVNRQNLPLCLALAQREDEVCFEVAISLARRHVPCAVAAVMASWASYASSRHIGRELQCDGEREREDVQGSRLRLTPLVARKASGVVAKAVEHQHRTDDDAA